MLLEGPGVVDFVDLHLIGHQPAAIQLSAQITFLGPDLVSLSLPHSFVRRLEQLLVCLQVIALRQDRLDGHILPGGLLLLLLRVLGFRQNWHLLIENRTLFQNSRVKLHIDDLQQLLQAVLNRHDLVFVFLDLEQVLTVVFKGLVHVLPDAFVVVGEVAGQDLQGRNRAAEKVKPESRG